MSNHIRLKEAVLCCDCDTIYKYEPHAICPFCGSMAYFHLTRILNRVDKKGEQSCQIKQNGTV